VVLYELLAGSPPLGPERLKEAALEEVLRRVREEEPPRPSARLSTSQSRANIAAVRQSEPETLARLVRGELDWIVMKCLEKDRTRRYETASALAADVRRYLAEEPVEARPPSASYRLRKFARRHRGPVAAAAVVLLALVAGVIGTTIGMVRAVQAEAEALALRDEEAGQRHAAVAQRKRAEQAEAEARQNEQRARDNEALAAASAVQAGKAGQGTGQAGRAGPPEGRGQSGPGRLAPVRGPPCLRMARMGDRQRRTLLPLPQGMSPRLPRLGARLPVHTGQ
jgi:hypothetical protein